MKKKIVSLCVAIIAVFTFVACGATNSEPAQEKISDESFATVQETYSEMAGLYNSVVDLYTNKNIKPDASVEAVLKEAKKIIEEMGEIDRSEMTEGDGETLINAMGEVTTTLGKVVDAMQIQ